MPHDVLNTKLVKGDYVSVLFQVVDVDQNENDCNLRLQAIDTSRTNQSYLPLIVCNSKLTKFERAI